MTYQDKVPAQKLNFLDNIRNGEDTGTAMLHAGAGIPSFYEWIKDSKFLKEFKVAKASAR